MGQVTSGLNQGAFYIQALASTGTVELTLSAPGYQDLQVPVRLVASGFVLNNAYGGATFPLKAGSSRSIDVPFRTLREDGTPNGDAAVLRAEVGAVMVELVSSEPGVARLGSPSAMFTPGTTGQTMELRGITAGSTIVRISTPARFTAPSRNSALYTVSP